MIVYGSRMYFKKNVVKSFEECEHCGVYGQMTSYKGAEVWPHLFHPVDSVGCVITSSTRVQEM